MDTRKNILKGATSSITMPSELSVGQYVLDCLARSGDDVALIDGETEQTKTFKEILDASRRLAHYMRNQNWKKNDRMAICSENSLNFIIPVCSAMYLGIASCPLSPNYTRGEFVHALKISKPTVIFSSATALELLLEISKELPWSPRLISMSETTVQDVPRMSDLIKKTHLTNPDAFKAASVDIREHVFAVLCSSGTTGLPKGVMLTDKNVLAVARYLKESAMAEPCEDRVMLHFLPFVHAYAFVSLITELALGIKCVLLSRFEAERFLSTIQKYKIRHLVLVPQLMVFIAKSPLLDQYDLSSVQLVWCGAASLSQEIREAVYQRLNKPKIKQGYGMTETTLAVLKTPTDADKPGSVGKLVANMQGKVIAIGEGASDEPLGPYKKGELCFKGDTIMKGYCDNESATSATVDKDGWLRTGDIGYYDEDGFFYIVDRLKELIKYKAFQVPPAEIEAILLTHPGIADAAVVGIPDDVCGELPLGFVVKQPQSEVTSAEIVQYVNARVSNPKWLRGGVRFVDAIPKTGSGKILRRLLRDELNSKL